jgi:phage terminase large subunit
MPTIELPNGWHPRSYQRPLWDYLEKGGLRAIEIAHRRWGKDDVILNWTAVAAMQRPAMYWHCLPEYEQARKAIWAAVDPHTGKRRIDQAFPKEIVKRRNEQEMFIEFKNGATWQVVGSDRYDALVGAGLGGVTFSEWALANPSAWGYMRPMVEESGGWAAFITTPRGRNHAKAMHDMAVKNPRWFAEVSDVHKTGALSPEQLDESLEEYKSLYGDDVGEAQFQQEYMCSFNAAILGAFYAREMVALRSSGRIVDVGFVPSLPVHRAWDIGTRDDTSIWWFQVVAGVPIILDCYTNHSNGVEHYADVCRKRREEHGWRDGIDWVPHDAKVLEFGSGRTRLETMVQCGLKPQLVPDIGKADGIQAARLTLKKAVFHPRTEEKGIAALEMYRRKWDDLRKMFSAEEYRDWSTHLSDAFRYLSVAWQDVKTVKETEARKLETGQVWLPGPPEPRRGVRIRI